MEQSLGKKLSTLRREHGLTQDTVAERLGVSPQAVSKWENDSSCPDVMLHSRALRTIDALLNNEPAPHCDSCSHRKTQKSGRHDVTRYCQFLGWR